jgi:hypothetical protein
MTRYCSIRFRELLQAVQKAPGDEPNSDPRLKTRRSIEDRTWIGRGVMAGSRHTQLEDGVKRTTGENRSLYFPGKNGIAESG